MIALDAKIQVDFNPDVVAYYRLIGYENRDVCRRLLLRNRLDFRNDAVDAGEIATVQLRWENPDPPQSDRDRAVTGVSNFNTWDLAQNFESADPRYQLAAIVAQYAELLRHSPWAAGTSSQQLVNHAYWLSSLLWDDAEVIEFASLVSRASQIRALGN